MNHEALKQLTDAFSVQDIMTNADELRRSDTLDDARNLFRAYDVIPYPRRGKIEGFFRKDSDDIFPLEIENLISGGTSLLEIPKLIGKSRFHFVITSHAIGGYVHYSDLNKMAVKILLFALFQAVERRLWDAFNHRITERDVHELFEDEAKGFIDKQKQNAANNVDLGWTGVFSFPRILKIARFYGLLHLTDREIKLLKETRNNVAHSDQNLVGNLTDVVTLAQAIDLFWSLLE